MFLMKFMSNCFPPKVSSTKAHLHSEKEKKLVMINLNIEDKR